MKKQRKLLIVAAIVLVALTAAYFVVSALLPEKPEEEKPALYINKKDTGYYNLVTVEDPDLDYKFAIGAYVVGENTNYLFADNGVYDGYKYSQGMLETVFTKMCALQADSIVEDAVADDQLGKYGLDEANAVKVTAKRTSDDTTEDSFVYLIGDYNSVSSTYYVKRADSQTIYSAKAISVTAFTGGALYFRDVDIIPSVEQDYSNLMGLSWKKPASAGGEEIVLEVIDQSVEEEGKVLYTVCHMTSPFTAYADDDVLYDSIISPLFTSVVMSVVKDNPTDEELAAYGLDDPYYLTIETTTKKVTFKISNIGGSSARYLMIEGENSVYYMTGDMSGLAVSALDLRSSLVWLHDIKNVTKLNYSIPSGEYEYLVDDTYNSDDNTGSFVGVLNGKYVKDEKLGRGLFRVTISLTYTDAEVTGLLESTPAYSISVTYKSGYSDRISLYKVNSRQYAVVFGDDDPQKATSCVGITTVREIDKFIEDILAEQ